MREYYVNDAGGQVDQLGASIDVRYRELLGESGLDIPASGYHGTYLIDLAQSIIDGSGDKYLQFSDTQRVAIFRDLGVERLLAAQRAALERFRCSIRHLEQRKGFARERETRRNH